MDTPRPEEDDVLSAMDVSVFCPSPTEGAPRAVIYAMLAGRPIVATGSEGVSDMIEPGTGMIVAPDHDPVALAACLREYMADPTRVIDEGQRGRRLAVERYDGATIAQRIESLVHDAGAAPPADR